MLVRGVFYFKEKENQSLRMSLIYPIMFADTETTNFASRSEIISVFG